MTTLFGPIKAHWNVEQAVLLTISTWLAEYLARVEEENGFALRTIPRPPVPESIHGGLDFDGWKEDELPSIIVAVNPIGEADLQASAGYSQEYRVEVACIAKGEPGSTWGPAAEDEARAIAGFYGAAVMLLVQQGALKGFAERTKMLSAPLLDFPDPEETGFVRSTTAFAVWVTELIREDRGPFGATPAESPSYGGEPEAPPKPPPAVSTVHTPVKGVRVTEEP